MFEVGSGWFGNQCSGISVTIATANGVCGCAIQVVESMRRGFSPTEAAEDAVRRIARRYPSYVGALIAVDKEGRIGAAAHGWTFKYSYRDASLDDVMVVIVEPLTMAEESLKVGVQSS